MSQKPTRRSYRPILRMNDLLHPMQQRERMIEFAAPDEPIGRYSRYSRLWTPFMNAALFVVKVPNAAKRLDEEGYQVLMQQRISWLIQRWMQDVQCRPTDVQRLLEQTWATICTDVDRALIELPDVDEAEAGTNEPCGILRQWREDWAEILVRRGDRLVDRITQQRLHFPVPSWDKTHPDFQECLELHNDTDLETWLALFTQA